MRAMSRLSLWNSGKKSNDYRFFDRTIGEFINCSGTALYVHLYMGPHDQLDNSVYTPPIPGQIVPPVVPGDPVVPVAINERSIQDVLFLENRDRKYSNVVYELRGVYNVADMDFDLKQFGLFLQSDTIFIEIHLNSCIDLCGRRLIAGDVIELPHMRDDTIPLGMPAINKFYVVEDASKASDGYSASWFPHIWRIKCTPMPSSQEFEDILEQKATNPLGFLQGNIGDLLGTMGTELGINEAIVESAKAQVPKRFFETQQFWFVPGKDDRVDPENPWVFAGGGDGIPPNGAVSLGSGTRFPTNVDENSYYLRTDYSPPTLFIFQSNKWTIREVNWRGTEWSVASRLLKTFINNDTIETFADGSTAPQKVMLSKALKPSADF